MKPLTQIKFDSFKVRIPKALIPAKDIEALNMESDVEIVFKQTGEVIPKEQYKQFGISQSESGTAKFRQIKLTNDNYVTSVAVAIEKQRTSKDVTEYVTLKITSKLLKQSYYEGISFATLPKIVEYLNSVGINISESLLLESEITDIDFCKDIILTENEYNSIVDRVRTHAKESKEYAKGYNIFNQKDNQGIEFSKRETATPNNPYLKIYSKTLDSLSSKHGNFFITYHLETPNNLYRIEATLKNKKHFAKYSLENTLKDFLDLQQSELQSIMTDITSIHIDKNPHAAIRPRANQDTDKLYQELALRYGIELDIAINQVIEAITSVIENRMTRKRHEEKFKETALSMTNEMETFKEKSELNQKLSELFLV